MAQQYSLKADLKRFGGKGVHVLTSDIEALYYMDIFHLLVIVN